MSTKQTETSKEVRNRDKALHMLDCEWTQARAVLALC